MYNYERQIEVALMMEYQKPPQPSLFYRVNLEQRVPADHPLRAIAEMIDFDFVYAEVEDLYGGTGKPSVPPPVILKLMFLLAYENVPSERRLMATVPLRLDWLWFLGLDLDSNIPDHSVLSKARSRWGAEVFRRFFERVVHQAVNEGLIDGTRIFCDGSLFDANASRESVVRVGVVDLSALSDELEQRLDGEPDEASLPEMTVQRRSTTDPDAAVVTKPNAGSPRPRYKAHRVVDDREGIITATIVTPGDGDEGHQVEDLINQHEHLTESEVDVVIADTQYGSIENYLMCLDRGIEPRMQLLSQRNEQKQKAAGQYSREEFVYDEASNTYRCPAGKTLEAAQKRDERDAVRYMAKASDCAACKLRKQCTNGTARSITRHLRQTEIDLVVADLTTEAVCNDLRRRKHFMERSFAVATRHGFKRCRWRGLWRAEIHELLVATAQNVTILTRKIGTKGRKAAASALFVATRAGAVILRIFAFARVSGRVRKITPVAVG